MTFAASAPADLTAADTELLNNPAWFALTSTQAAFAIGSGTALRYRPEVSVFAGVPTDATAEDFARLAALLGEGEAATMMGRPAVPEGWRGQTFHAYQMVDSGFVADEADRDGVIVLGDDDVPEMVDLVRRTEPGPFAERTIELGGYVGVRLDGKLVAMAGERQRPRNWAEVSAVCTDPDYRGQGLAARVVRAVTSGIRARGDRAFLHVAPHKEGARRVYERQGFVIRTEYPITAAQPIR